MPTIKKKLTIGDIAEMSGVSKTAVSFILNNREGVSEQTRKKVQKIIDESNYKPILNSRRLILKKSFNIAIVFDKAAPVFSNMFYFEVMGAVMRQCADYDYSLVYSQYVCTENDIILPANITERDVDGLIFLKEIPPMLTTKLLALEIPFVIADDHTNQMDIHSVRVDYNIAAYTAVNYLIQNGHREIGFIGKTNLPSFYVQMQTGFQNALRNYGISTNPRFFFDNISDMEDLKKHLPTDKKSLPTAFFCMEDMLAIQLIRQLQTNGIHVPDDISVISVDNICLAEYVTPSLTTIAVDMNQMGAAAADIIIALINKEPARSINIPANNLIIRDSVKKLK